MTNSVYDVKIDLGDKMIFLFLDFLFLLSFSILKLVSLVDNSLLFTQSGSKLNKYINRRNQLKSTCNFEIAENKFKILFSIKDIIVSPLKRKHIINILLANMTIIAIKIALTYKLLFRNFSYITIFNKNIDLVSLFKDKYIVFIYLYYLLSAFFILNILLKCFKYKNKIENINYNIVQDRIYLGEDIKNNLPVYLTYDGLYQNLLITGSIGSGKTSSAISNILNGLIKNNTYGLIIDVKGNYINTLKEIAKKYDKEDKIQVISMENDFKYNPMNKPELSSIELANYMIKVLKILSKGNNNSDPFWFDKSEAYIRDFITLIRAYNNNFVNFMEIHKLVTSNSYIEDKLSIIKQNILNNEYSDEKLFEINSAISNIKNEYLKLDERVIGIIKSEITRLTNIFVTNYDIYNKFCTENSNLNFFDQKIVILSMNIGKNRFLSKVISTYLKLDFQQQILSRENPNSPVFFICDEFQEIVNSEDSNFFSISREYKAINIISVQSYNSIINALQDERSSMVIIQNLVNKIWFRNDDMFTVKEIINQIGKEQKDIETMSYTESGQNSRYSIISNKFKDYKTGLSKSYSVNKKEEYKFNEEYITSDLKTFEAMCFLSDGNKINIIEKVKLDRWGNINEKIYKE